MGWDETRQGLRGWSRAAGLGKGQGLVLWGEPPGTLGSCTKLGDGSLLCLALRLVPGVRRPAACMALLSPISAAGGLQGPVFVLRGFFK